jgi:hypothetical protein
MTIDIFRKRMTMTASTSKYEQNDLSPHEMVALWHQGHPLFSDFQAVQVILDTN